MSQFLVPLVLDRGTADPGNPEQGVVYYNTTSNKVRVYTGSEWIDLNADITTSPLIVSQDDPAFTEPGLWIETDVNEDIVTFWVETGGA